MNSCLPIALGLGLLVSSGCKTGAEPIAAAEEQELAAARALFEKNIKAIQDKNREAYLACYRPDERLVRTGPDGPKLGYSDLAEGTAATGSDEWPSRLDAKDMTVHWVAPGVVYGTYKYTVVIAGVETSGLSERVFLKNGGTWQIGVSTAFETPPTPAEKATPKKEDG